MARNLARGVEIPGLKDQAIGLDEMMGWVVHHTTIKEDEGADPYHVKVRVNSEMTFNVTPDEPYMSLKEMQFVVWIM